MEHKMRNMMISYQAKPERIDENRQLIEAVFAELAAARPENLHYAVLELGAGSFVHLVSAPDDREASPLLTIAAFEAFTANAGDRHLVKASQQTMLIVGNYRLLAGDD
jgi:hypothetical protein